MAVGTGSPSGRTCAGRLGSKRKFVSARRDILLKMLRGRGRTKIPGVREIRGAAVPHGANERGLDANRGS